MRVTYAVGIAFEGIALHACVVLNVMLLMSRRLSFGKGLRADGSVGGLSTSAEAKSAIRACVQVFRGRI